VDSYPVFTLVASRCRCRGGEAPDCTDEVERFVFAVSDANFERYSISAASVQKVISQHEQLVATNLLLIASRDGEAEELVRACPASSCLCLDNQKIPSVMRRFLTESLKF